MKINFPTERIFPDEARWQLIKAWLRGIFLEDWAMKLIALGIALALWFAISGQRSPITRRFSNVKLNFQYPTGLDKSNNPRDAVEIVVTGDKRKVESIVEQNLAVSVDLSQYKEGDYAVQLKPETVTLELPNGVKLEEIEPNLVSLILEKREEKLVDVKPAFTGQLPEGYEIYETTVSPVRVRVRGTTSQIATLKNVPTEKIDLENHTADFTEKQVTIDLQNPKVTVLDSLVDVAVKIGEERIEKTFAGVAVQDENGGKAVPETATVTLQGGRSVISQLRADDLKIIISTSAVSGTSSPPRLILPAEVEGKVEMKLIKPNVFTAAR